MQVRTYFFKPETLIYLFTCSYGCEQQKSKRGSAGAWGLTKYYLK